MNHKDTISGAVVMAFIALLLMNFLNIRIPISMTTGTVSSELAVVGEGKVDIVPDTAFVDVGVSVTGASSVEQAQKQITEVNNAIIAAVQKLGIKKEDVKTTNYSINPNITFEGGKEKVDGYNGNATITVKTSDIDLVPQIITGATAAGANQVQGARFSIDKPETYRAQARNMAIANAKEQAAQLAKNLGIKLGKVTNIVESTGVGGPEPVMLRELAVDSVGGSSNPTIEPGQQTISSIVTLYFEKR